MITSTVKGDEWRYYWDNGQLYFEGNWNGNLKHGPWKSYYPTGNLLGMGNYNNGLRDGDYSSYYDNGNMKYFFSFTGCINGR